MSIRLAALRLAAAALFVSFIGASCGQSALGLLPGVVNDPHNLSLRRSILDYGTSHICSEVQKTSLPLKLREEDPILGRFHASTCFVQALANNNLLIQFSGFGWVWTNLTQRMSFDASGAVEYDTDFLMDGSTMYVYFRQKSTTAATFAVKLVEQPQVATAVLGSTALGGGQNVADNLGSQIMRGEIGKGFTVVRRASGEVEFGLGVVEKGEHPAGAQSLLDTHGKRVLANERAEVHQNQRDFVGPVEIPDGKKLGLAVAIDGAPAMDLLVIPRYDGEAWLQTYTTQAATTPPPNPPVLDEPVFAGALWKRTLALPPGLYYVVLDNTPTAGKTMPTGFAHDDRAVLVNYALTVED
jgi:hypothetical protein